MTRHDAAATASAVLSKVPGDGRAYTSYVLTATGLCLWTLQTYAFHGNVPAQVSGALYTLVPAGIGYLATHIVRARTSPTVQPAPQNEVSALCRAGLSLSDQKPQ